MRIFSLHLYQISFMPRRKRLRKVVAPPGFKGYKPYGTSGASKGHIELLYEEYEAIKLVDYDIMNQLEASKLMGISRPTMARIYKTARMKIAQALVEKKEIRSVFGNAWMDKDWFLCSNCNAKFTLPETENEPCCPVCKTKKLNVINNN